MFAAVFNKNDRQRISDENRTEFSGIAVQSQTTTACMSSPSMVVRTGLQSDVFRSPDSLAI